MHSSPAGHVPQLSTWLHWSTSTPQLAPSSEQVVSGATHALMFALQNSPATQPPQSSMFPQPSG